MIRCFTHKLIGVPSSANWKPTNPFNRRHQNVVLIRPMCAAVKYWNRYQLWSI